MIYSVDFLDQNRRVGCREQELQLESDPWIPTRFEFRDKVTPKIPLGLNGDIIAQPGDEGEIEKALRDYPGGPAYHARFKGRTLLVPESALEFRHPETGEDA
jgi:nitrogen fixation protein NifZ